MNHSKQPIAVAIDGPSGAGKSTMAKVLAEQLQFVYVDTGALYRSIGYYALRHGVTAADWSAVIPLLEGLQVELCYADGAQQVLVNGENVTGEIRTPAVSMAASGVSALPPVRAFLFQLQRDIATRHNVIMDGRDIGTVVLPDAKLKIFLTASAEDRAQRRFEELRQKGTDTTFAAVLADMKQRDYDDEHRAAAPLKAASDAVLLDTTGNTLEQTVALLKAMVQERL